MDKSCMKTGRTKKYRDKLLREGASLNEEDKQYLLDVEVDILEHRLPANSKLIGYGKAITKENMVKSLMKTLKEFG